MGVVEHVDLGTKFFPQTLEFLLQPVAIDRREFRIGELALIFRCQEIELRIRLQHEDRPAEFSKWDVLGEAIVLPDARQDWSVDDVRDVEFRLVRVLAPAGALEIQAERLGSYPLSRTEQVHRHGNDQIRHTDTEERQQDHLPVVTNDMCEMADGDRRLGLQHGFTIDRDRVAIEMCGVIGLHLDVGCQPNRSGVKFRGGQPSFMECETVQQKLPRTWQRAVAVIFRSWTT